MGASRLTFRLVALALLAGVGLYVAHLHGEIARLRSELTHGGPPAPMTRPGERPPVAPLAAARPEAKAPAAQTLSPRTLTAEQRKAMLDKLTAAGMGTPNPIWFATMPNNPETEALQQTLQKVFEEAGWQVRGNIPVRFSLKAGIYVFSADETPPDYVGTAQDALEAAGLTIASSGRGYRDFYKQKKEENPNWIGFEMAPDQTYVVAIGRKPEEPAAVQ